MTHHYNIEIVETNTHLKATYRDKKFRKLEHLRGKLDNAMLRQIGRIVPRHEDDFGDFNKAFENKVNYTIITQEKSLYTKFLDEWLHFYSEYAQLEPKFTGADGKALKQIIGYLQKLHGGNDNEALELWRVILSKWNTLPEFHQNNTDLKYINSKLNIIIHAIKQQNNTFASGTNSSVQL